ncbi:CPBP family intramembrane glutamic endopeptidase [Microbacterium sp. ABRD28]|uniref:CPBP family intramembrane glutamic endopeptidase n=1 Tax=Microbacterium sp. ABRD28 TaxID=2268461 RepID=UPI000F55411E|nr:CPBP family intramembrane glutamic endopeptidase [Microbacterium sp. ABRD28]AZC12329.1 CPBP family intramembrane metalloprotease [Microbacterium sp. ABRD28]
MLDHSSDVDAAPSRRDRRREAQELSAGNVASAASAHRGRTDWRLGGRTVRRWREWAFAAGLIGLGLGVLVGAVVEWVWDSPWAPVVATVLVWIGMVVPTVLAFRRSRPVGLLRFRAVDLLWGVGLATALRLIQGWLAAGGGAGALPSFTTVDGALPAGWWLTDLLGPIVIAPPVEELFFRGLLLVTVFTMLRRPLGQVAAGIIAMMVSTGLFVLAHTLTGTATADAVITTALLGLTCAAIVMLTGRIWGAVLVHAAYNPSYVALAAIGTLVQ